MAIGHLIVDQLDQRLSVAKSDSDFTYFFTLLLRGEAVLKLITTAMVGAISEDADRINIAYNMHSHEPMGWEIGGECLRTP